MFLEYLACNGSWLKSSYVMKGFHKNQTKVTGSDHYVRFKDLRDEVGPMEAKMIRAEKRRLQAELEADPDYDPEESIPFIMKHPDVPGAEDWP